MNKITVKNIKNLIHEARGDKRIAKEKIKALNKEIKQFDEIIEKAADRLIRLLDTDDENKPLKWKYDATMSNKKYP